MFLIACGIWILVVDASSTLLAGLSLLVWPFVLERVTFAAVALAVSKFGLSELTRAVRLITLLYGEGGKPTVVPPSGEQLLWLKEALFC